MPAFPLLPRKPIILMNAAILSTLSALCKRQRLPLALGVVLMLGVMLFNHFATSVDINGWSSGFTHPLHGGDHFLTMLAVGIWAAQLRGKAIWLLPLTFVGVMSLGGLAGAAGLFIPSAELIILVSGLVFSVFIVRRIRFSSQTNVIIVAFFAFFHGFAHGQEISTSASLISYTLGFMIATLLLHGAGILIVRLLVVIFALFVSQLAFAQSAIHSATLKTPIGNTKVVHLTTPNLESKTDFGLQDHNRQRLYSGEDGGGGHKTIKTEARSPFIATNKLLTGGREFIRAVHQASNAIAYTVVAHWLLSPQISIHFLTNGVGDTAPPVALLSHDTPYFCSAAIPVHHEQPIFKTIPYFVSAPVSYTLATSFLTNGVGTTSPPVLAIAAVVSSLNESALCNSPRFTALSRSLYSSHSIAQQTRYNSRSPPLAFQLYKPFKHNT